MFGFSTNADATVLNGRWTKAVETHYDEEFPIKRPRPAAPAGTA